MAFFTINSNPQAMKFDEPIEVDSSQSSSSSCSPLPPQSRLDIHHRKKRYLVQNHRNFERSGLPVRIMFYQGKMWVDFPAQVTEHLRWCFSARKPAVDLIVGDSKCVFDFLRMLQINLNSGNRRSIAWIDERGKCFFPKEFVVDSSENPIVEIEFRVNAVSEPRLGKRTREIEFGGAKEENEVTSSFRTGDSPKRQRSESLRLPNAKLLNERDEAYVGVRNRFLPAIRKVHPAASITAVHQCTAAGPMAKARRAAFAKQMEITKTARGAANIVHAWYPLSAKAVSEVLTFGFGPSNGGGGGVRLSSLDFPCGSVEQTEAGSDDDGEKHFILCAVILGNLEKVEADSHRRYPSSGEFDTGADDLTNPKWYMVWPTNVSRHILPEYVVSYKSVDRSSAQLEGLTRRKYTFTELFAKLKSCISPVKFHECITLYKTMKAGKMTKDLFIKHFRDVAGEKVLLSAIREICGAV